MQRPDVQAFAGALQGAQASRGIFIATTRFSRATWTSPKRSFTNHPDRRSPSRRTDGRLRLRCTRGRNSDHPIRAARQRWTGAPVAGTAVGHGL
ncbi:restriction endonuclease [Planotetraspora silvatica]|uniref:restriction endonuclease n=1 Tax=Planotetraspora silvatica TaxID=234614 RepID=UPI00194F3AE6